LCRIGSSHTHLYCTLVGACNSRYSKTAPTTFTCGRIVLEFWGKESHDTDTRSGSMYAFEKWARASTQWGDYLLRLGASWDTFRNDEPERTIQHLKAGGIPHLEAISICELVAKAIPQIDSPVAVFWDTECLPPPSDLHFARAVERIQDEMARHGSVEQFRCYRSVNGKPLSTKVRSEIIFADCDLVEIPCPTECTVTVDALNFTSSHADGALLCFIADPVRCSALLSEMRKKQCFRSVVIWQNVSSVADIQCNTILDWKQVVGGSPRSERISGVPLGFDNIANATTHAEANEDVFVKNSNGAVVDNGDQAGSPESNVSTLTDPSGFEGGVVDLKDASNPLLVSQS